MDVDMTAMVIQALAPYYKTNTEVRTAVDTALALLSDRQDVNGGYASYGDANSESNAQVLVALTALGIDPEADARFLKNGHSVVDALCAYYVGGGRLLPCGGRRVEWPGHYTGVLCACRICAVPERPDQSL